MAVVILGVDALVWDYHKNGIKLFYYFFFNFRYLFLLLTNSRKNDEYNLSLIIRTVVCDISNISSISSVLIVIGMKTICYTIM